MSTSVKFVPVLHENTETKGIVGTDVMNLDIEVPNEYKIWLKTPSTNASNRGMSFQTTNTNKFMDSNERMDLVVKFGYTGRTYEPKAGPPILGTPPILWSPQNCKIDALCVNKLIQRISFNIQNKQWSEEQRTPELFDVLATQFDLEKLESYGIDPFTDQGQLKLARLFGRGVSARADFDAMGVSLPDYGIQTATMQQKVLATSVQKAIEKGYVTYDVNFYDGSSTGTLLSKAHINKYGTSVPISAPETIYWTNPAIGAATANPLYQEITLTIHEYIISPSTSNPYAKNNYSKTYYVGTYPVNQTFDFNTSYFSTMIKNLIPTVNNATVIIKPTLTLSPEIQQSELGFFTFDSSKELVNPYQRTLYYNMDFQTISTVSLLSSAYAQLNTSTVTTANLSSLRPYIAGWVSNRIYDNPALVSGTAAPNDVSTLGTYQMQDMQNVRIQYGSQTDCMLGTQLTWREITDLTQTVTGNPKLRNMILGEMLVDESGAFYDHSVAGANFADVDDVDTFWHKMTKRQGMKFFIIPTARLNWRPILQSDVPTIPEFNYGSNHYKSLIISMDWYQARNVHEIVGSPVSVNYQPVVILFDKRVRSIPMDGQGPLFDERIEYDYINNNAMLSSILQSFFIKNNSANDVNDELQFVGGSFIGNIVSKIRRVLPHLVKAGPHLYSAYKEVASGKKGRPAKRR